MLTPMGTILIIFKPLLVLDRMPTMPTILTPDDDPLIEPFLAQHTEQVTLTIALGDRLLAPATGDLILGVDGGGVGEFL